MKLAETYLSKFDEKLSPKKMKDHKAALKHATEMLGNAKVRYSKSKDPEDKDSLDFWTERVQSITSKMKEK
jgi:hypothetical protein